MIDRALEVGRVTKAHGLKGEVVVDLVSDYPEVRLAPGSRLWTGEQELVVRSSRPFQQRWLVQVEGVHDRTGAERLAGRTLSAEPLEDPEALWVHQLIGSRVVEQGSGAERGPRRRRRGQPGSRAAGAGLGALVPIVFVQSCEDGVTLITPPEGLFDVES